MDDVPLLGRDSDLNLLRGLVARAAEGDGRCVFVAGEPGIGKSRLCEELQRDARRAGFVVAWGRAWDGEGAPALWPWIQVLRRLEADAQLSAAVPDGPLATVRRLCAVASPSPAAPDWFDVADPIVRTLVAMSARAPLLLVLDDMHAADERSLEVLRFAVGELRGHRILVVMTLRDVDARGRVALSRLLDDIERRQHGIRLEGLSAADVRALLDRALGVAVPSVIAEMISRRTEGNPLLVLEMGRLLATAPVAGFLTASDLPIPGRVIDVLRGRLNALGPDARALVQHAAVIGREAEVETLARMLPFDEARFRGALDELHAAGLLVEREPGRVAFAHALHRSAIYRDLAPDERARLHLEVARLLEPLVERGDRSRSAQVAFHFERAGTAAEAARDRWRYDELAGEHAASVGAREEAERHFSRALALAPDDEDRIRLGIRLADVRGLLGKTREARDVLAASAVLARRSAVGDALARVALAGAHPALACRPDPWLVEALTEALPAEALRPLLEARLSTALTLTSRRDERHTLGEHALAGARALGPAVLGPVLAATAWSLGGPEDVEARLERARELLRLGERARDPELQLQGQVACTLALLERDGPLAAGYQLDAARALAQTLGHPYFAWWSGILQATLDLAADRVAEADSRAADALAWGQQHGFAHDALVHYLLALAPIRLAQGRATELPALIASLEVEAPELPMLPLLRLRSLLDSGQRAAAREAYERLAEDLGGLPRDRDWLSTLVNLADVAVELGDSRRAEALLELLRGHASAHAVSAWSGSYGGPVARVLGRLARLLGRTADADAWLEQARALARASGAARELVRIEREVVELRGSLPGATAEPPPPGPATTAPPGRVVSLVQDDETWILSGGGRSIRLRDSKGLRYLAELLAVPGRPVHVVDLATTEGASDPAEAREQELDDDAVRAYRKRLDDLDEAIEEADRWGDLERARRARVEREMVLGELAGGVGLGGRKRRAGSPVERMRQAVTKRLRDVIRRVEEHDDWLGAHLVRSVRTGRTCIYEPSLAGARVLEATPDDDE